MTKVSPVSSSTVTKVISVAVSSLLSYAKFEKNPQLCKMQFNADFCQTVLKDVKRNGFINPLLVAPMDTHGKYRVLIGHNRLLVAKHLNITTVQCIVLHDTPLSPKYLKAAKHRYYSKTNIK